ncbi:DUF927 domain-containing protein [Desulfovibrio aerotolerans]|uniref:DUF927 domain-containing protein n=1 Tax=Solidesulfovibrio aerotolerans TaxID=295255 RepID=A0A7C9MR54_9BACT|nr:DUF927 domain-containing protein [Solidesulfovibrio aerotolerans]MYL85232.1 DUF927 domain-containing protein [Solidesulfovibrio aerotolerans]
MSDSEMTNTPAIIMGPEEFLKVLWAGYTGDGILNLWTLPDKLTHNFKAATEIDAAATAVYDLTQSGQNVYVQMGLQAEETGPRSRGKEATTTAISGFWHDTDIAGPGHKQKNLPPDLDAALALIFSFPLLPTLVVHSGGGLYPIWMLHKPWVFASDGDRDAAKALSMQLQGHLNELGRQRGYVLDSTANLDRVLRIPGGLNQKDPANPRPVQVIFYEPRNRYSPEEIAQALPPVANTAAAPRLKSKSNAPAQRKQFPLADYAKIVSGCTWLRHCVEDAASLPQPEWYAALSVVGRCLDGHAKAHDLSMAYPGYSAQETDKKIADAVNNAGPRTCVDIRTNCGGEMFCSVCSYWGKVTSPILLGTSKALGIVSVAAELAIPGAPVPNGTVIPAQYGISLDEGIWRYEDGGDDGPCPVRVCPAPVVIVARSHDVNAGTEFMELGWYKDRRWYRQIVSRRTVADVREILELSSYGLPVTSLSARQLVLYLEDFEVANKGTVPLEKSSSHLGWQSDDAFLWGVTLLTPSGKGSVNAVAFRAEDTGDAQIAQGFHAKGTYDAWVGMANLLYSFTKVFIVVMAALCAPFLRILRAANFVVDIAGETSKGKTTTQIIGACGWGNPDHRMPNSALHTWDATDVWFERLAALLNGLPDMLDDTKNAKSADAVGDLIYRFVSGKGKGRGTTVGTRVTGTWQSILISSGEQGAVDYAKRHAGAKARVLSLWGSPFGDGDQGKFVKSLEMAARDNYGHAGPKVVQFILDHRDDWPLWRGAYAEMLRAFSYRAGNNGVANRLSEILAFFAVTIPLIHAALPELKPSRPIRDILDELWPAVVLGAEDADKATEAVKTLWGWAVANQAKFWGRHKVDSNGNPVEPNQGWAGRWDNPGDWKIFAVTKGALERVLDANFEVPALIKTWCDRKWLEMPKSGKGFQRSVRIGNAPCDAYVFSKATLSDILGMDLAKIDKRISDDEALR